MVAYPRNSRFVNEPNLSEYLIVFKFWFDYEQVCASEIPLGLVLGSNVGSSIGSGIPEGTRLAVLDSKLSNGVPVPTDLSDSSDSEGEHIVVPALNIPLEIPACPVSHTEGRTVVDSIIPCDVDQLFTLIFTNSKFYLDFHVSRKTFSKMLTLYFLT